MTVEQIMAIVADIQNMRFDDEAAHGAEDGLWGSVLAEIASGKAEDPAALASAALQTRSIKFSR